MSQPAKAPEPSIDEILASIRRSIVPDEDADKPAARKPAPRKQGAAPVAASSAGAKGRRSDREAKQCSPDVAGDPGSHRRDGRPPLKHETRPPGRDPGREGADHDPGAPEQAAIGARMISPAEGMEAGAYNETKAQSPLLSSRATAAAVDTAFNSLTHTVLSQNPRTLEDLVREMLKPMLKAWLDANLPNMVERLVRAEIERVSRRG
jgi:cell pole-organizing protein PopZ